MKIWTIHFYVVILQSKFCKDVALMLFSYFSYDNVVCFIELNFDINVRIQKLK